MLIIMVICGKRSVDYNGDLWCKVLIIIAICGVRSADNNSDLWCKVC